MQPGFGPGLPFYPGGAPGGGMGSPFAGAPMVGPGIMMPPGGPSGGFPGGGGGCAVPPSDMVLNHICQEIPYSEIREGTSNFSSKNRLGEGSYGAVFLGALRDGTEVAVKKLANPKEGGFREEVQVLSKFRHPNLVILMGFSRNGKERFLIYEMMPGGDLHGAYDKDKNKEFTWDKRLSAICDSALGLSHLHGSHPRVFHRDIKSQNILLDKNGTAKVADFGLALLGQANQTMLQVQQKSGTLGYADPKYIQSGTLTEHSEVYSFGMVMLEVLTNRPPALQLPNGSVQYQFEHIRGSLSELGKMCDQRRCFFPPKIMQMYGALGLRCIQSDIPKRPLFAVIVAELRAMIRDKTLHGSGVAPVSSPSYDRSQHADPRRSASGQNQWGGHAQQQPQQQQQQRQPGEDRSTGGYAAQQQAGAQVRRSGESGAAYAQQAAPSGERRSSGQQQGSSQGQQASAAAERSRHQPRENAQAPANRGGQAQQQQQQHQSHQQQQRMPEERNRPPEDRRPDPMLGDRAVTFAEMCHLHRGNGWSAEQLKQYWSNLKDRRGASAAIGAASAPTAGGGGGGVAGQGGAAAPAQEGGWGILNWLNGDEDQDQPPQGGRPPQSLARIEEMTKQLMSMGFPEEKVQEALKRHSSIEAATEWLFSQ